MTNEIIHYDLFAGIGGFSYAIDQVFYEQEITHIFIENDPFCQAVIRKHWPEEELWGDIREFATNTQCTRLEGKSTESELQKPAQNIGCSILTGGFPCQPFSQAGVRKGVSDDRYLWPEMLRVIREAKPKWVIAENVTGLLTIQDGLVFEQVCADLENEGYQVQPYNIPACAVGAPHQRQRIWIVAYSESGRQRGGEPERDRRRQSEEAAGSGGGDVTNSNHTRGGTSRSDTHGNGQEKDKRRQEQPLTGTGGHCNAQDLISKRRGGRSENGRQVLERKTPEVQNERPSSESWERSWQEVAFATCHDGVDDGLPRRMDGTTISPAKHRKERLKACGNAIVPQVAMKILEGIKEVDNL